MLGVCRLEGGGHIRLTSDTGVNKDAPSVYRHGCLVAFSAGVIAGSLQSCGRATQEALARSIRR